MEVGVATTRTRALAMAEEREEEEEAKRRKLDSGELELSSSLNQHKNRRPLVIIKPENIPVSPEISTTATRVISSDKCLSTSWEQLTSSRCSSNGSMNVILRSDVVDPESEGFRFENSTFLTGSRARRETTPSSTDLIRDKSTVMPSSEANSRGSLNEEERMPSEAEIESFFSAVEKEEEKRFTERYNYDIVKDVPLEGRFVWVPVTP